VFRHDDVAVLLRVEVDCDPVLVELLACFSVSLLENGFLVRGSLIDPGFIAASGFVNYA